VDSVDVLLEEFKIFLESSSSTQSLPVYHTVISPGVWVWFWARSQSPGFLLPESESESHKNKDSASLTVSLFIEMLCVQMSVSV